MATFTVTTLADGTGTGTLRGASAQANATAAADTIALAHGLEGGTLTLTQGRLRPTSATTIDGDRDNDGREVQVSGNRASRAIGVGGSGTDARLVDPRVPAAPPTEPAVGRTKAAGSGLPLGRR